MNVELIETDRYLFRPIQIEDRAGMFEMDSDPEVHRYLGNNPIHQIEQADTSIQLILKQYKENGIGRWAIINKANKEFVGWTGLKWEKSLRKEFNYYDLGYRLKKKYWGLGIATISAKAFLKYGFINKNLDQICAAADPKNIASNKILINVGLLPKGTFIYDSEIINWYELTKSEWTNNNGVI